MTGWLGEAHLWVRAAHLIFVVFWMAAMFMLPRYLVYQHPTAPGSPEEALWTERVDRLRRIILMPSMILVWLLGLALALHIGFSGNGWLIAKIAIVFVFTGLQGWMTATGRRMADGERPIGEGRLRMLNEVPSLVAIVVIVLAVVRPFCMLLTGLRIWDGSSDDWLADADCIRIEGERIAAIGPRDVFRDARDAHDARDCSGLSAIPGLIDAHVHLCLDPSIRDPLAQDRVPVMEQLDRMGERAHAMVRAGITTARDLGGGRWLELGVRDAIAAGALSGPRLLCAGQPITSPGGHCHFWGGEAADADAALAVLERQVEYQVDLIKVMATGGSLTPGSRPKDAQFDLPAMSAIVAAARARGLAVAAHCHGTTGIDIAARAGVTTIEHCSWVGDAGWGLAFDADVAARIAATGIRVSPTVNSGWRRHLERPESLERIQTRFARMRAHGIRMIASTDAGIPGIAHDDLPRALPVFATIAGLTPVEALRSATSDAADALGLGAITGRLAVGHSADLLLIDGDPLTDPGALARVARVFARGRTPFVGRSGPGLA